MKQIVFLVAFLFLAPYTAYGEPMLDYFSWKECRISSPSSVICFFDDHPALANHFVVEYRDKESDAPTLLMWEKIERSKEKFRMHGSLKSYQIERITVRFYRHSAAWWELVEEKEIVRAQSPKNQRIPFFDADSPFGKMFTEFWRSQGRKAENIQIPYTIFVE